MEAHGSGVKAFLGFMDHSIAEQLIGEPGACHTTAIVLAEGAECGSLAKNLASHVNRRAGRLRKWSSAGSGYRRTFARELGALLPRSGVVVVASSVTERTIIANRDHVAQELQLTDLIHEYTAPSGTSRMKIGPFTDSRTGADHFFDFSANRALMVFWISHFVSRAHKQMAASLRAENPALFSLDWFLYVDKFAGDNPGAASSGALFQTLVTHHTPSGNVRTAFFNESDSVSEDLLADNIAGLLNERRQHPSRYRDIERLIRGGCFYYETDA